VALAPPFYVLLAQQHSQGISGLGLLIIASGLAGSISAPLWGKLSDRSSRRVMIMASLLAGITGIMTWLLVNAGLTLMNSAWIYTILFFLIAMFHGGVRLARKVYLVDMASEKTRSIYVAVSNTVIGITMLAGGLFGVIGDVLDTSSVILVLALLSCLAALYIARLPDVSG
jgi:MFS family permease